MVNFCEYHSPVAMAATSWLHTAAQGVVGRGKVDEESHWSALLQAIARALRGAWRERKPVQQSRALTNDVPDPRSAERAAPPPLQDALAETATRPKKQGSGSEETQETARKNSYPVPGAALSQPLIVREPVHVAQADGRREALPGPAKSTETMATRQPAGRSAPDTAQQLAVRPRRFKPAEHVPLSREPGSQKSTQAGQEGRGGATAHGPAEVRVIAPRRASGGSLHVDVTVRAAPRSLAANLADSDEVREAIYRALRDVLADSQ